MSLSPPSAPRKRVGSASHSPADNRSGGGHARENIERLGLGDGLRGKDGDLRNGTGLGQDEEGKKGWNGVERTKGMCRKNRKYKSGEKVKRMDGVKGRDSKENGLEHEKEG